MAAAAPPSNVQSPRPSITGQTGAQPPPSALSTALGGFDTGSARYQGHMTSPNGERGLTLTDANNRTLSLSRDTKGRISVSTTDHPGAQPRQVQLNAGQRRELNDTVRKAIQQHASELRNPAPPNQSLPPSMQDDMGPRDAKTAKADKAWNAAEARRFVAATLPLVARPTPPPPASRTRSH